jgi:hypothetical protein
VKSKIMKYNYSVDVIVQVFKITFRKLVLLPSSGEK